MIVFDLICSQEHRFEAWFRSSADYEEQQEAGAITCPVCSDGAVRKAPMAPNVAAKGNQQPVVVPEMADAERAAGATGETTGEPSGEASDEPAPRGPRVHAAGVPDMPPELGRQLRQFARRLRDHVEQHCDYVGNRFAEEARKIHYGESEQRGIYGEATTEESAELEEEGTEVMPLPFVRGRRASDA